MEITEIRRHTIFQKSVLLLFLLFSRGFTEFFTSENFMFFPHCASEVEVSEVVVVRDVELEEAFKVVDFERLRPHSGKVLFIKVEKSS